MKFNTKNALNSALILQITASQAAMLTQEGMMDVTSDRVPLEKATLVENPLKANLRGFDTIMNGECVLEVQLDYPVDEDDGEVKHDDIIFMNREGLTTFCNPQNHPEWCNHEVVDEFDIFTLPDASSTTTEIKVAHWYNTGELYNQYATWMSASKTAPAVLTITNKSKDVKVSPDEGFSQPKDMEAKLLQKDKKVKKNRPTEHESIFSVSVTCTKACHCTASGYTSSLN